VEFHRLRTVRKSNDCTVRCATLLEGFVGSNANDASATQLQGCSQSREVSCLIPVRTRSCGASPIVPRTQQ
jgi:hypothetical protein